MKRTALMVATALLLSAGVARAQETVSPVPASPVEGGKVIKAKAKPMTAVGAVKSVAVDSLVISDATGKDWTFSVDAATKVMVRKESVNVGTVSPVKGGKETPATSGTGQETIEAAPASPIEGGKVIPTKKLTVADLREGQRVQVSYHTVDGKMLASSVKVM